MRSAPQLELSRQLVEGMILTESDRPLLKREERESFAFIGDQRFTSAWTSGLGSLPIDQRRGILAVRTGQIAEAAAAVMIEEIGYVVAYHFRWAGIGVDLIMMNLETGALLAVEVKGTLRPGHWPRLRTSGRAQFTKSWLNNGKNRGMRDLDLRAEELFGLVFLINFADMKYKLGFTTDFENVTALDGFEELAGLAPT